MFESRRLLEIPLMPAIIQFLIFFVKGNMGITNIVNQKRPPVKMACNISLSYILLTHF